MSRTLRSFAVIGVALVVFGPLGLIIYQSFLSEAFFSPTASLSLGAYRYVLTDSGFHSAFGTSLLVSLGMTLISVPLGSLLAFLLVRTDLPGKKFLEPWLLVPIFLSPVVLAFGYVVAVGPVGFFSLWTKALIGRVPWNLYSLYGMILIAGLTHVPHSFLYVSSALRTLDPSVEEAARVAGAGPWRIAATVSMPLVLPSILFSAALIFLLGFELFGLPLVLGDPAGLLVLTTYLYKLTNLLGVPSYHLMAVVALSIVALTFPLVYAQRRMLRTAGRFAVIGGKGQAFRPLPLGALRWPAVAIVLLWLVVTVLLPLIGVALRSVVSQWGEGIKLSEVLTLDHFRGLLGYPNLVRGIVNTLLIGGIGGALSEPLGFVSRLPGHVAARASRTHRRPGFSLGVFIFQTDRAFAHHVVQLVDCLYGCLARLWIASDLRRLVAGETRTGGSRARYRRGPRHGLPRRDAAAHSLRSDRQLAARVHDVRARILDRSLFARARHRSDRLVDCVSLGHRCPGFDLGSLRHRNCFGRVDTFYRASFRSETRCLI